MLCAKTHNLTGMKRWLLTRMLHKIGRLPAVYEQNRQLKIKMQHIVKHRNELLGIIVTSSQVTDITGYGEPLFITKKSLDHSIVFNVYNYDPEKLAAAEVALSNGKLLPACIDMPEHTPAHLRTILVDHIETESRRLGTGLAAS